MNNWASVNDASDGTIPEGTENEGIREPSNPVNVYSKVTKNMWIVFFNPNESHQIETEAKNWDNISDADREYRYEQVKKRLDVLNE